MFVLGVDPGLTRCGYGLVRQTGRKPRAVAAGVIRTPAASPLPARLAELADNIDAILAEHRPDVVAIEGVFFQVNVRSAMSVGQASGIVMAAAHRSGSHVVTYTPNEVKLVVAGSGSAPKDQVMRMVAAQLGLAEPPKPADTADALALALCHLAHAPLAERVATAAGSGDTNPNQARRTL